MQRVVLNQEVLLNRLKDVFHNTNIFTNLRKESPTAVSKSGVAKETDIWIPSINLCFEFQDAYHYVTTWYSHHSLTVVRESDSEKIATIKRNGLSLIVVPCWWDGSTESLKGTILFERPDLRDKISSLSTSPLQIDLNPPARFFSSPEIPDIGEPMLASFPTVPDFHKTVSPTNFWWLGEKYDGIRCCWNSTRENFYSRHGNILDLLPVFFDNMPSVFLDTEFWFGRGDFVTTQKIAIGSSAAISWHLLKIVAFDVPMEDTIFEHRYERLLHSVLFSHPFIINAPRLKLTSENILKTMSREILKGGGEGIVLRKPASLYLHGRTSSLLKLKASQEDKEGLVVDIRKDNTVSLQMTDGSIFDVQPENVEITEIEVGDVVSFSFDNSVRKEAPSNPRIYRKRTDVSWEQLVRQFIHEELHDNELPMRESKEANHVELREFLERFAGDRNMDPLQPNTWYSITLQDILLDRIGRKMKKEFKAGYYKTLVATFPELSSTIEVNKMLGIHLWGDIENRKKFFEDYAKEKGFDPLIAENWYSHPLQIMQSQRARGVMAYYNGSVSQALACLFPNVGIVQSRFSSQHQPVNWINMDKLQNKRDIFSEFANEISNDTKQLKNKLFSFKRDDSIVFYKSSSPSKTMADFFPNSKATSKVEMHSKKYWRNVENRKKVFDDYAKQAGFDPRNPEQWYLQARQNIIQFKNVRSFLGSYQGNVGEALVHLYPTIGLDIRRFPRARNYWSDSNNRKKFFDEYAGSNNFDPLDASKWENVSVRNLLTKKGAVSVLQYYDGSIKQGLNVVYGIKF